MAPGTRAARGRRRARALAVAAACAALAPRPCRSEAWDISATIYSDNYCFEYLDNLLLVDGTCYSTRWYTNSSKAFMVKLVGFGTGGAPWVVNYQEFSDDCHTPASTLKSLTVGKCGNTIGRFRGVVGVKLRSSRCTTDCSNLAVATQNFYDLAGCAGVPILSLKRVVPLQGECLAARNGSSQTFTLMHILNTTRITRVTFPGNAKCTSLNGITQEIRGQCYPLFSEKSPRSFGWTAERPVAVAGAPRSSGRPALAAVASTALAAVLAALAAR